MIDNARRIGLRLKHFLRSDPAPPNGQFPPQVVERLEYVGDWLKVNGEAIYQTRSRGGDLWREGKDIRFTRSKDRKTLYAISLTWPGDHLTLQSVQPRKGSRVHLLGCVKPLKWRPEGQGVVIEMPEEMRTDQTKRPCQQAYGFRLSTEPEVEQ